MKRFDEFYSLLNELQNDTGNSSDDGDHANHMRKFFINSFSNPVIFDNYFELYSNKMRELANRSGSDIDQLNKNLEVINKRRDAFISHLKKADDEIWDATDGKIAALSKIIELCYGEFHKPSKQRSQIAQNQDSALLKMFSIMAIIFFAIESPES